MVASDQGRWRHATTRRHEHNNQAVMASTGNACGRFARSAVLSFSATAAGLSALSVKNLLVEERAVSVKVVAAWFP